MSYAIEVLEKERQLLENCLSKWDAENYPEARKERNEKYKNLMKSIEYLKSNKI
jgi:hypothetical protein